MSLFDNDEKKELRKCRICQEYKPTTEFQSNGRKYAVENRCKLCVKKSTTKIRQIRKYAPNKPNHCECCGVETEELCLDHDHHTLKFRGWLCSPCNRGIGQLGDNEKGLIRALKYLRRTHNGRF